MAIARPLPDVREVLVGRADHDPMAFMALHVLSAAERLGRRVAESGKRGSLVRRTYSDDLLREMYAIYRHYQEVGDEIVGRATDRTGVPLRDAVDVVLAEVGDVDSVLEPRRAHKHLRIVELQQKLEGCRPFGTAAQAAQTCLAVATECFAELLLAPLDQERVKEVAKSLLRKGSSTARAAVELAIIAAELPQPEPGQYKAIVQGHVDSAFGRTPRMGKRPRLGAKVRVNQAG